MRRSLGRVAATAMGLLTAIAVTGTAYADTTTGSLSGQFVDTSGNAVANATVTLYGSDYSSVTFTTTDATGAYSMDGVAPGTYYVSFQGSDGLTQYAYQKQQIWYADPITVTGGANTTVNETEIAGGAIAGTLTDASGQPVSGAWVNAFDPNTGGSGYATTDGSGHYSVALFPGSYTVSFQASGLTQYAHQKLSQASADQISVAAGQDVTLDEQLLPTGSMSGRFTDANGNPMANMQVMADLAADGTNEAYASTDSNGDFQFPQLFAASYKVNFVSSDWTINQWAYGKLTLDQADTITVAAGQNTVVNDSVLPTGTATFTAHDAVTGAPITNFCVSNVNGGMYGCSDSSGSVVITAPQGSYTFMADTSDNLHFTNYDVPVTITGGQNKDVSVALKPGSRIDTVIEDSATGAPVPGACVMPLTLGAALPGDSAGYCADSTGAVHIGPLPAGSYTLYAKPGYSDTVHGGQWVGPDGGTGDQLLAAQVKTTIGDITTAPTIKLDHAGSVTGVVTDSTGKPLANAVIATTSVQPGIGATGQFTGTDSSGRYTLTRLGPYAWPLFYAAPGYAAQWSGGAAVRYLAKPVQVIADASATADATLTTGATFSGTVHLNSGTLAGGYISAVNAVTGDVMGYAWAGPDGAFSMQVLAPQSVQVHYQLTTTDERSVNGWYLNATDRQDATVVLVKPAGTVLDIPIG